jgi:glycerophosphoryl diester phosphodiesterase
MTGFIRVGHKGADGIAPGNTLESFHAAAEAGVDVIELDVLRPRSDFADGSDWRTAPAGPATAGGPLVVAHDWGDAARRDPLTLDEVLDAFTKPPLAAIGIDLDIKVSGREDEILDAIRSRGLLERTMTSTMELPTIRWLGETEPALRRGWTLPKVRRDWTRSRLARPVVLAGMGAMRARLPSLIRRRAPELGVQAIWLYHPLATAAIAKAVHDAGCELICWTVDEVPRMEELLALGADGLCTNDPRLFAELDRGPNPASPAPAS